ncbi:MAG: DegT/DnrJ/EryC1/StrS family aminotransferase [Clostridiales bacterium]|jgi:dTDP-4-amino-4,6-dideoxygalactose transaminase|nr:DegT/DnrJ/EryC1/StrS family aminotransferase [Clostridiales bacterium]
MSKNPIRVTRSSMPPMEEYIQEIKPLWESHWLTNMGDYHQELERQLTKYLEVPNLSLFANGHMALELTLQAMHLSGEVITTPFTFASTTHAIVRNGLKPVFCDIDPKDFTIDAEKIKELINENTCAILPVHVYGHICNVEAIEAIARRHKLKVIYDAAHAFGETLRGAGVGSFGDASIFSFHATKVFHTIEGGASAYGQKALGEELYQLKNFGILSETAVEGVGSNAKMNEFQAAMGICNLRHFQEETQKRRTAFLRYRERLEGRRGIVLPKEQEGVTHNYGYFPVVFEESECGFSRDAVYDNLKAHNVYARKYFYPLTSDFACYHGRFDSSATPVARHISQRVLTLPLYAGLSRREVDRICRLVLATKQEV